MNAKCASCKNFWGSSEEMKWDGGYNSLETHNVECKNCLKALANFKH